MSLGRSRAVQNKMPKKCPWPFWGKTVFRAEVQARAGNVIYAFLWISTWIPGILGLSSRHPQAILEGLKLVFKHFRSFLPTSIRQCSLGQLGSRICSKNPGILKTAPSVRASAPVIFKTCLTS